MKPNLNINAIIVSEIPIYYLNEFIILLSTHSKQSVALYFATFTLYSGRHRDPSVKTLCSPKHSIECLK